MALTDERYFATYCRLDTQSEELTCTVNGDGVGVGIELAFAYEDYVTERGKEAVRGLVKNPLGETVGFLPAECCRRVCDLAKAGWTVRVSASAVGFHESDRTFWIEAAVFAYEPQYADALGAFVDGCLGRMGSGERPDIRLSGKTLDAALEDKKLYKTIRGTSYPKLKKGDAYYKRHRTTSESMIRSGSQRKLGCWVGTIAFYLVIALIVIAIVYVLFIK